MTLTKYTFILIITNNFLWRILLFNRGFIDILGCSWSSIHIHVEFMFNRRRPRCCRVIAYGRWMCVCVCGWVLEELYYHTTRFFHEKTDWIYLLIIFLLVLVAKNVLLIWLPFSDCTITLPVRNIFLLSSLAM